MIPVIFAQDIGADPRGAVGPILRRGGVLPLFDGFPSGAAAASATCPGMADAPRAPDDAGPVGTRRGGQGRAQARTSAS